MRSPTTKWGMENWGKAKESLKEHLARIIVVADDRYKGHLRRELRSAWPVPPHSRRPLRQLRNERDMVTETSNFVTVNHSAARGAT